MKLSLNSLKAFNAVHHSADISDVSTDELIEKIGSKLGAIESLVKLTDKYSGIFIVEVKSCTKHEGADKLSVCLVDDKGTNKNIQRNSDGLIEVVCGAPNVKAGIMAVWIPPGKVVPSTADKEPLTLESKEIRGVVSSGMLASLKELDFGDSHEGIVIVEGDYHPGQDLAEAFTLKDDVILDLENKMFTHRPDCFGNMGLAREVAGILGKPFKSPDWYSLETSFEETSEDLPFSFTNELPELVRRFCLISIKDVSVKDSPLWLQIELAKAGLRSINNIVDATNLIMLITAQPLHAYDYDKVKALSNSVGLIVRNPKPNENLTLLNGKTIQPRPEAIMIATDKQLIGLGGIMGGQETEVDASTKNVLLECANFDMYSIRRTSMANGLFSDAVTRFTKGQSPLTNPAVIKKTLELITSLTAGSQASKLSDFNKLGKDALERGSIHPNIDIAPEFINKILGLKLSAQEIAKILENVEFKVEINGDILNVHAPFWRTDIELREDVVEEVGRLYGYDKLPLSLPTKSIKPADKNALLEAKDQIRRELSKDGASEVLTYSFVHERLLKSVGQDPAQAFSLANALSPNLQYYRLSLLPSLLEKVHPNIKAGFSDFALFEIGKVHSVNSLTDDGLPKESERTAFVIAKQRSKNSSSSYYLAKKYLCGLVNQDLKFEAPTKEHEALAVFSPFNLQRTAHVLTQDGQIVGALGEIKESVKASLKLPDFCAGFEVTTETLSKLIGRSPYRPISRFPSVYQDLTLKVDSNTGYNQLRSSLNSAVDKVKDKDTSVVLTPLSIFQKEGSSETKNISFRLSVTSFKRTLTDQQVNKLIEDAAGEVAKNLKAERV
ncbi:MAG TPA: phenylalanine--tRNA ligase subunit beta [Candidatus Sulfotelmatobacter sp.]|nr:phenylalanine--tRNA ligase subunit beta [Candidatus Sulfotelmatobacter sp.]